MYTSFASINFWLLITTNPSDLLLFTSSISSLEVVRCVKNGVYIAYFLFIHEIYEWKLFRSSFTVYLGCLWMKVFFEIVFLITLVNELFWYTLCFWGFHFLRLPPCEWNWVCCDFCGKVVETEGNCLQYVFPIYLQCHFLSNCHG